VGWNGVSVEKSLDFQGPPLPMALEMDIPPSKSFISSAIKTTGTLVILCTQVFLQEYSVFCNLYSVVYVCEFYVQFSSVQLWSSDKRLKRSN
jgi:hypothetical protein